MNRVWEQVKDKNRNFMYKSLIKKFMEILTVNKI